MFWATGVHETLQARAITHLVFTGVTTEVCVQTSMREANDRGYDVPARRGRDRKLLPASSSADAGDDRRAGRDRRLARAVGGDPRGDRSAQLSVAGLGVAAQATCAQSVEG